MCTHAFCYVHSVDRRASQILNGHAGTFAKIKVPGRAEEAQVRLFAPLSVGGGLHVLLSLRLISGSQPLHETSPPPSSLPRHSHTQGQNIWSTPPQVLCFEEKKADDSPAKLYVLEVGRDKDAPGGVFRLSPQHIPNTADTPNDFPVAMQVS